MDAEAMTEPTKEAAAVICGLACALWIVAYMWVTVIAKLDEAEAYLHALSAGIPI